MWTIPLTLTHTVMMGKREPQWQGLSGQKRNAKMATWPLNWIDFVVVVVVVLKLPYLWIRNKLKIQPLDFVYECVAQALYNTFGELKLRWSERIVKIFLPEPRIEPFLWVSLWGYLVYHRGRTCQVLWI